MFASLNNGCICNTCCSSKLFQYKSSSYADAMCQKVQQWLENFYLTTFTNSPNIASADMSQYAPNTKRTCTITKMQKKQTNNTKTKIHRHTKSANIEHTADTICKTWNTNTFDFLLFVIYQQQVLFHSLCFYWVRFCIYLLENELQFRSCAWKISTHYDFAIFYGSHIFTMKFLCQPNQIFTTLTNISNSIILSVISNLL